MTSCDTLILITKICNSNSIKFSYSPHTLLLYLPIAYITPPLFFPPTIPLAEPTPTCQNKSVGPTGSKIGFSIFFI